VTLTPSDLGISLETALVTARQTLASVTERATQHGYYSGARTEIINAHADLRVRSSRSPKLRTNPARRLC
jgi:hypothetical protein